MLPILLWKGFCIRLKKRMSLLCATMSTKDSRQEQNHGHSIEKDIGTFPCNFSSFFVGVGLKIVGMDAIDRAQTKEENDEDSEDDIEIDDGEERLSLNAQREAVLETLLVE